MHSIHSSETSYSEWSSVLARGNFVAGSHPAGSSRREEYAEATRLAIIDAARRLFSEQGYFATKVDEIAALARVSPATVYAVSGGKNGLLRTLTETWASAPIVSVTLEEIDAEQEAESCLRLVAASCRRMREEFGDIMRVLLATAPHDEAVAQSFAMATARYREAFLPIGRKLVELGALRQGVDLAQTLDVLWFYFGYSGLFTLRDDNGWTYDRAECWLYEQAARALLEPAGREPYRASPAG
ncbi:MAG TPA: helix-turn-helix domain-containing protein [Aliidongia sp.]|nr:helix-turn-helix domain-containing protein [Aliidongia sp.]